jgi:RNA polymerase sigma-70 factor (ECF subfamily)
MKKAAPASQHEAQLLLSAKRGDKDALRLLFEPHRRELRVHCYRMLGTFHDAEDLVQETFLRAWRGLEHFDGRATVRYWLYRIATNACLNALAARAASHRVLPESYGPPTDRLPDREPAYDTPWLDPYPDSALDDAIDRSPPPDVRYDTREAVQLAFMSAIHYLPPRQRAALLLRDVLGWSAAESARLLESSVASLNSALQRARATLEQRLPEGRPRAHPAPNDEQRALLARYVHAWETSDVDEFAAVLKDDAIMSMPPWSEWYRGRAAISKFFAATARPGGHAPFRLTSTAANGQPALAFYSRWQSHEWRFHSVQVLTFDRNAISIMTSFVVPSLASVFNLPDVLPDREPRNPSP